jgi:hypothetical protein
MEASNLKIRERREYTKKDQDMITLKIGGEGVNLTLTASAEDLDEFKARDYCDFVLSNPQTKLITEEKSEKKVKK